MGISVHLITVVPKQLLYLGFSLAIFLWFGPSESCEELSWSHVLVVTKKSVKPFAEWLA